MCLLLLVFVPLVLLCLADVHRGLCYFLFELPNLLFVRRLWGCCNYRCDCFVRIAHAAVIHCVFLSLQMVWCHRGLSCKPRPETGALLFLFMSLLFCSFLLPCCVSLAFFICSSSCKCSARTLTHAQCTINRRAARDSCVARWR